MVSVLVSLAGLLAGSYTDLRTREVPDWINYGLIFAGIGIALMRSVISWNIMFLVYSLIGLGVFYLVGAAMYYTGQWGGGDSKMMMGLGALIGINWTDFHSGLPFLISFFIYTIFIGAVYGLVWSLALAYKRRKEFKKTFSEKLKTMQKIKIGLIVMVVGSIIATFFIPTLYRMILLLTAFMLGLTFYMFIFIKSVEKSCMLKQIATKDLTEGDWIAEEVKIKGKLITGPKDLGIQKHQIAILQKSNIKKVLVKEGIPFVPSFLGAFIVTMIYGSSLFWF